MTVPRKTNTYGVLNKKKVSQSLRKKLSEAHVLALLDFNKVFELETDALETCIGTVLNQEAKQLLFSMTNLAS